MFIRSERRRSFQPPWYTVDIHKCEKCGHEMAMRRNWHGSPPDGGIYCTNNCGHVIRIDGVRSNPKESVDPTTPAGNALTRIYKRVGTI